jgi:putative salt-induced outer membrane protein YdiY/small nuclear ribonucleoprotein (snRNP)-like protein
LVFSPAACNKFDFFKSFRRNDVSKLQALAVTFIFLFPVALFADQIVLKNGDRLTGVIETSDDKALVIKTEFAGEVTVQWSAIQDINSTQTLNVILNNGKTVAGKVTTSDGNLNVATTNAGTVTEPKDSVTKLMGEAQQAAYEKALHPGLLEGWQGGANIGFGLTRGNSETKNLALAFTADRKTMHDKLSLYTNSIYATNDAPGATPSTTANAVQGGARYDHDLTPRLFGYVGADFQTDALQTLDLRSVFGGGLGLHAIKNDRTTLDLLAGLNYTREKYTALPSRSFAAFSVGEELTHKLGVNTLLTEKLYIFPNLNDTGEYRGVFNFGTVTKISKWLGWQNAFGDIYVTNPPAGAKQNDILLTTGLNFSFPH